MRSGRGYTFHYLVAALAVASSNLRRIRNFFEKEAARIAEKPKRSRRRTVPTGAPVDHADAAPATAHAPPD